MSDTRTEFEEHKTKEMKKVADKLNLRSKPELVIQYDSVIKQVLRKFKDGEYKDDVTQCEWLIWQTQQSRITELEAATSKQAERIAQLELALKVKDDVAGDLKYQLNLEANGLEVYTDRILAIQPSQEALEVVHMIEIQKNIYEIVDAKNVDELRQHIEVKTLYRLKDK